MKYAVRDLVSACAGYGPPRRKSVARSGGSSAGRLSHGGSHVRLAR